MHDRDGFDMALQPIRGPGLEAFVRCSGRIAQRGEPPQQGARAGCLDPNCRLVDVRARTGCYSMRLRPREDPLGRTGRGIRGRRCEEGDDHGRAREAPPFGKQYLSVPIGADRFSEAMQAQSPSASKLEASLPVLSDVPDSGSLGKLVKSEPTPRFIKTAGQDHRAGGRGCDTATAHRLGEHLMLTRIVRRLSVQTRP